jgi:hypothetical protein
MYLLLISSRPIESLIDVRRLLYLDIKIFRAAPPYLRCSLSLFWLSTRPHATFFLPSTLPSPSVHSNLSMATLLAL